MDTSWLSLIPFLIACGAAAATGAAFPPGAWYKRLDRPGWTPPDRAFPVVWTILYVLIAWAGWRVGLRVPAGEAAWPLGLWACQIALNALWTPVFFGLHRPDRAVPIIVLLWLAAAAMLASFLRVDPMAGLAVAPYLLWLTLATALNVSIWRRNPDAHRM